MASIIYALIANENSSTPLAEIALASGNFQLMALKLLDKCRGETNSSKSYAYESQYIFHYHNKEGVSFLCMTDSTYSNRRAFEFLFQVHDKVFEDYGSDIKNAIAFSLKKHFIEEVKEIMLKYNQAQPDDKIAIVQKNVDEVTKIMVENLDKVIQRGEKIEILVSKTDQLQSNAKVFSKTAVKVKRHFLCKNIKLTAVVALILLAVLMLIVILSCGGFSFSKCS